MCTAILNSYFCKFLVIICCKLILSVIYYNKIKIFILFSSKRVPMNILFLENLIILYILQTDKL